MIDAQRGGSIVNVSSQAALVALDDHLSYSASKAALDAVTRALCVELGPFGIRVNSVNPTVTLTPMAVLAQVIRLSGILRLGRFRCGGLLSLLRLRRRFCFC